MERLSPPQIRDLAKIDLHRHLDCSVRWSTIVELLGPQIGKTQKDLRSEYLILEPMLDLGSVLRKFTQLQKILSSEEILERLGFEACEDAFNEGIRLLELRYSPTFIQEKNPHLSFEKIHMALIRGVQKAQRLYPLAAGIICIIQRTKSFKVAEDVCSFAIEHKDTIIGLDLADDEKNADPKTFASLFNKAKAQGLGITVHSGETPDDLSALWVRDSVEILEADRIGHGVQIIRNPSMVKFIAEKKIPLEVCLISNYLTQAFPNYNSHPLRKLYDEGVLVTLNSDDPGIFNTTLTDEYQIAQDYHSFTKEDFININRVAYAASFIPESQKKKFAKELISF